MGTTEWEEVGETIGQGSSGAAVVSGSNLDEGVSQYFNNSDEEISYGKVRLQPQLLQDDILRMAANVQSARNGNEKLRVLRGYLTGELF